MTQPDYNFTFFAKTNFRNQHTKFGIKQADRRHHTYIIGKTGTGKSTLLENLIVSDLRSNKGLALLDPHGDLVERMLDLVPSYRINDVIYFDPSDIEHPIPFNILSRDFGIMAKVDYKERPLVASSVLSVFKKLFAESWGPRTEHLLRGVLLALLERQDSTLLDIPRFFMDDVFREKMLKKVRNKEVKRLWEREYTGYDKRLRSEAIAPILNKVGAFLTNPIIRHIIGQQKTAFDMRKTMDEGKILLVNLSKGRIGEDVSMLLGSLLITKIQLAAMSRVNVAEEKRRDFYLYIDEFQDYANDSFAEMLAEARKMRINIIIANQFLGQVSENIRAAILGNVGTIISFRVGSVDAEILAEEFYPKFRKDDFVKLGRYSIYLRLMIDGVMSEAFSAVTLPPVGEVEGHREKIVRVSRERYGKKVN